MKLGNMVRFSPLRSNGPVITHRPINANTVVEVINSEPGLTGKEIASRLSSAPSMKEKALAYSTASNLARAKVPKAKKVRQDGLYRFYPINYKLTTDPKPEPVKTETAKPSTTAQAEVTFKETAKTPDLEQLAMQYVWETGASSAELKSFLAWHQAKQDKQSDGSK